MLEKLVKYKNRFRILLLSTDSYKNKEYILSKNIYKIIVLILWIVIMFILLRKLAKKDNEFYLKDFFKKKK